MIPQPEYILEFWTHGVLILSPGSQGVPVEAFTACCKQLPKNAVMDGAISHHYRYHTARNAVAAAGTSGKLKAWREHIEKSIMHLDPETRWFLGTDVGTSSAAIFAVLCHPQGQWKQISREYSRASTPSDSDDLGRCLRLIERFPEWESRLSEVAESYPTTHWPMIVDCWQTLMCSEPQVQREILNQIHSVNR